jgi:hypothetical protein
MIAFFLGVKTMQAQRVKAHSAVGSAHRTASEKRKRRAARLSGRAYRQKLQSLANRRSPLSEDAKEQLRDILGRAARGAKEPKPAPAAVIRRVEQVLGLYRLLEFIDSNRPRPSTIAKEAKRLRTAVRALSHVLRGLDESTADEVTSFTDERLFGLAKPLFPDPSSPSSKWRETLQDLLARVEVSSDAVASHYGARESRGRPRNHALEDVVRKLCQAFDEFFIECTGEVPKRLNVSRVDFVIAALDAGDLPHPDAERMARDYITKPGDD